MIISPFIPDLQVNNARLPFDHIHSTISRIFFIISHREDLEFFEVLNLKRKKVTKTPERSGLEPKTIRSRIFGLSTWAICELTIAGGKKSIKPFRTGQPQTLQHSLHRDTMLSSRTFRVEGQVSGERTNLPGIRLLFPSASKIPA